ncbi:MAG: DNA polymerase IV [Neisseriales bacterium]|nr:MAG: DNA polymerase IV [Neisseriales bacterium]
MNILSNNLVDPIRKIIHIDMDCFYAAVEIRDNPSLTNLPVAVGGSADKRGVLCTCNYIARKFGLHSAMPTSQAIKLCPELVLLPVNFAKYKQVSRQIHEIFKRYTDLVEPLALDEAYLDVSNSPHANGSATQIAEKIRQDIFQELNLTCSAGVSANKFLAKIASGWNKPNGIMVIPPQKIAEFIQKLPVNKLFGVGKVTALKLKKLNIHTCLDLQKFSQQELVHKFGKFGSQLFYQSRGIDNRQVNPNRIRKSLSVERTYPINLQINEILNALDELFPEFEKRLKESKANTPIRSQFIKIKLANFKQITREQTTDRYSLDKFREMLESVSYTLGMQEIRLLGIGISFNNQNILDIPQPELF